MKSVSIVGPGRVGGALALSLPTDRYRIDQLIYRESPVRGLGDSLSTGQIAIKDVGHIPADIVFITTTDGDIAEVAASLAGKLRKGAAVFHTSGSRSSSILEPLARDVETGSIHPLVSISEARLGPERFRGSYFCVEGTASAVDLGKSIVADLGGRSFTIPTESKTLYHAAAVTACGHMVALFDAAVEMMTATGLSIDEAKIVLLPLVQSTVLNLNEQSTAEALTGTFARADSDTFTKHIEALNRLGIDELIEIYLLLGERSLELAAKQGVSSERLEILRTKVAVAKSKLKW